MNTNVWEIWVEENQIQIGPINATAYQCVDWDNPTYVPGTDIMSPELETEIRSILDGQGLKLVESDTSLFMDQGTDGGFPSWTFLVSHEG